MTIQSAIPHDPSVARFDGAIPETYDTHLGPLLFHFSASDLARRVAKGLPRNARVLEVACGTGIATEHLFRALDEDSLITATDLNPGMLAVAKKRRGNLPGAKFEEANALYLPYEDNAFDAVVCQFGTMFFPDKVAGLREMTRVVKPGGRVLFNVWGSLDDNLAAKIAHETISAFFRDSPPRFLEVPFGDYDAISNAKRAELAGLSDVTAHVVRATIKRDARSAAQGLVEGTPGVIEIKNRADAAPETITAAVAAAYEQVFGSSEPEFELAEIVFVGTKR